MAKIDIEQNLEAEIGKLVADMDGERCVVQVKSRVGTVKLRDRRTAQIHLAITTDKDEFLAKPRT